MNRKNKILLTLSILLLAVVVALLWTVQSFSLNASVCSAPIPGRDHRPAGRGGSPLLPCRCTQLTEFPLPLPPWRSETL